MMGILALVAHWFLQSSTDPADEIELLGILVAPSLAKVPHAANKQNLLSDLCHSADRDVLIHVHYDAVVHDERDGGQVSLMFRPFVYCTLMWH